MSLFQVYFTQNLGNSPIFLSFFSVTDVGTLRREDSGNASLESPSSREASRKSPSFISGPSLTSGNGGSDYCALLPEADQEGKQFGHQQRWSNNSRRSSDASIIEIEEMEFDSDHIGKEEEEQERHERNSHGTRSRSSSNFVTFSDQQTAAKSPSRKRAGRHPPPPPALRSAIEIRASLSPVVRRINETPGMGFSTKF